MVMQSEIGHGAAHHSARSVWICTWGMVRSQVCWHESACCTCCSASEVQPEAHLSNEGLES